MKKLITQKPAEYDFINHLDLRSDLENDCIEGITLVATGQISESPKTWAIDQYEGDEDTGNSYLYESKSEYEHDLKIIFN